MKPCSAHRTHPLPNRPAAGERTQVSRRDFLQILGLAGAGALLAGCQRAAPGSSGGDRRTVAIAKAASYDPKLVRRQLETLLDQIGGLGDVLAHGKRVAIKTNLTGGTSVNPLAGLAEIDSYLTHPEVVRALAELLRDAGVKDLFIVEAVYEAESWPAYGYTEMAKAVGATLVDLNDFTPYKDFAQVPSSTNPFIYEKFTFNPILQEVDAFISVSKMKCHNTAGVTHTMKNLVGLVPYRFYTLNPQDKYRSGMHGEPSQTYHRLPATIIDLNRARPVNLGIIDGILTTEGGEGPWIQALKPIKPGLLFAGKDPVAVDAVATAAMGFDPQAEYPLEPFVNGENHLNMAAKLGLGTNRLDEIKVLGAAIDDVKLQFTPSY
jgi:uncharacterized protein (DUF362 family)